MPWVGGPPLSFPSPEGAQEGHQVPQSLARIDLHTIFSTKQRAPVLTDSIRDDLHRYLVGVLRNLDCPADIINSVEDHAHILCELSRTITIAKLVEEVKKSSSKWIKTQGEALSKFAWQAGYGAFAVSRSNCDEVRQYIANQREHHRRMSFQEEFRLFLRRHGIQFDERYVWD